MSLHLTIGIFVEGNFPELKTLALLVTVGNFGIGEIYYTYLHVYHSTCIS